MGARLLNLEGIVYRGLEKALETGTFLHRAPIKDHGGLFTKNSEIVEMELWKQDICLCERNLKGVSCTGDPEDNVKEGPGDGQLSIGAPLGNLKGAHFQGTLRDGWGTWEEGSVYWVF